MYQRRITVIAALAIMLTSCSQRVIPPIPTDVPFSSSSPADENSLFLIEVPEIGLSFPYWEQLHVEFGAGDYAEFDPARKGESLHHLTGSDIKGGVSAINYDRPSGGFWDWSIPRSVREKLRERTDAASCSLLKGEDVYVPVNMQRSHWCKATVAQDMETPVIVAIGFGYPFESPDYLESMIIFFAEERAFIVHSLVAFPETNRALEMLSQEHVAEHPDTQFPNAEYEMLAGKITSFLEQELSNPTPEMENNRELLLSIGRNIRKR